MSMAVHGSGFGNVALQSIRIVKASESYEMEWRYRHDWLWRSLAGTPPKVPQPWLWSISIES